MDYLMLGKTDILVSRICLGTMNFGEQNTEKDAHVQLDYALDQGINFIDTAEMYPVPGRAETSGLTETYIGNWIAKRNNRHRFILATKISGPGPSWIRKGPKFNRHHILAALEASLKRLKTEYIDLYQLHWPERKTNFFGRLAYTEYVNDAWEDNFLEILQIMSELFKAGKIRTIGISNETPWGTMRYLYLARMNNLPEIVSVQNPYNLLNRTFEIGMSEISRREGVGLLAYSPLAFGVLTGKYYKGKLPENTRLTLYSDKLPRYNGKYSRLAADDYCDLARKYHISPAQMALAFVNSRDFLVSNIIGATSMEQLREDIESISISLAPEILREIEDIHRLYPNPAP